MVETNTKIFIEDNSYFCMTIIVSHFHLYIFFFDGKVLDNKLFVGDMAVDGFEKKNRLRHLLVNFKNK